MRRPFIPIRCATLLVLTLLAGCDDGQSPVRRSIDLKAPERVSDAAAVFSAASNEVLLTWTAPYDDLINEPVTEYSIRFLYVRNVDPSEFTRFSVAVEDPPPPAPPGSLQEYVFGSPKAGYDLYIEISSLDEAGNSSPPSERVKVRIPGISFTGRCTDVYTGEPLPGLDVQLSAGEVFRTQTDASGAFTRHELPAGVAHVFVWPDTKIYYEISELFEIDRDFSHTFAMVPVQTSPSGLWDDLLTFTRVLTGTTDSDGSTVLRKWPRRPVKTYVPPFLSSGDVDYEKEVKAAAQHWMDRTGLNLFTFVSEPPDTGIILHYKPPSQIAGSQIGITWHTDGSNGLPLRDDIEIRNTIPDPVFLFRVALHELGHTIRFGHLRDPRFIMYGGQPLPEEISTDEVEAVRLYSALPNGTDMASFVEPGS